VSNETPSAATTPRRMRYTVWLLLGDIAATMYVCFRIAQTWHANAHPHTFPVAGAWIFLLVSVLTLTVGLTTGQYENLWLVSLAVLGAISLLPSILGALFFSYATALDTTNLQRSGLLGILTLVAAALLVSQLVSLWVCWKMRQEKRRP
jgi:FtsH-binding integral membrane protein